MFCFVLSRGSEGRQVKETKLTDTKFAPQDTIQDCGKAKNITEICNSYYNKKPAIFTNIS